MKEKKEIERRRKRGCVEEGGGSNGDNSKVKMSRKKETGRG